MDEQLPSKAFLDRYDHTFHTISEQSGVLHWRVQRLTRAEEDS